MLRQANVSDIPAMHRVRLSVRENRLTSTAISEADYLSGITDCGRGWVVEFEGVVVGFAIANGRTGNIWALFVDPQHEGKGYGRQLHDTMTEWAWSQGLERLWLTTSGHTRAQGFYLAAGWKDIGRTENGEVQFELLRPQP